ncbi:MAG: ABC transporter permease [Lacisediminihabitans sp.]
MTSPAAVLLARKSARRKNVVKQFVPLIIVVVSLGALFLWLSMLHLDSIEQRTLNPSYIIARVREHIGLTLLASALVALIAIPAGIIAYASKSKAFRGIALALGNIGQATPAVGLIILIAIWWQTGFFTALIAIVAYSILPVLRNTLVGLEQVSEDVRNSARGMGMTRGQVLRQIELPLASPVILAGLRTSLVFAVGVATIATFINAGGLGDMIVNGLKLQRFPVIVAGAVLVASIALLIDWLAGLVQEAVRPRGL